MRARSSVAGLACARRGFAARGRRPMPRVVARRVRIDSHLPVALAPLPDVGVVLQCGAVGTAFGTAVAARARRRAPGTDTSRITGAWTLLGLGSGTLVAVASEAVRLSG